MARVPVQGYVRRGSSGGAVVVRRHNRTVEPGAGGKPSAAQLGQLRSAADAAAGSTFPPAAVTDLAMAFAPTVEHGRDPSEADGACIDAEYGFRRLVAENPEMRYRSWYVTGPTAMTPERVEYAAYWGSRPKDLTHTASAVSLDGVNWWAVDFTYSQFDETAAWPLIESEAAFLARFTTREAFNQS